MPLNASERIHLINEIGRRLAAARWPEIDMTLDQFQLPLTEDWSGSNHGDYVIHRIRNADDESLLALASHLDYEYHLPLQRREPTFWERDRFRLFLSHLAKHRNFAGDVQHHLADYGVSAFVAHNDIEPTREWQDEIESALATCNALLALLHRKFHESIWTDQEIGYAMGRDLLIVSVTLGTVPYGFIGKFQALRRTQESEKIAEKLVGILWKHPKTNKRMAIATVDCFCDSDSFDAAKRRVDYLQKLAYWDSSLSEKLLASLDRNYQIYKAYGVPEKVERIVNKRNRNLRT